MGTGAGARRTGGPAARRTAVGAARPGVVVSSGRPLIICQSSLNVPFAITTTRTRRVRVSEQLLLVSAIRTSDSTDPMCFCRSRSAMPEQDVAVGSVSVCLTGDAENAGLENSGPKCRGGKRGTTERGWKTQDWKT